MLKCKGLKSLTLCTLTSLCLFSILFSIHSLRSTEGEFVKPSRASLVVDQFVYSRDLNLLLQGGIVRRN